MTLHGDIRRYVTECGGSEPWEADTTPIVKRFALWEPRELVALGAILILMGGSVNLGETMRSTCKLHELIHMHQDVTAITEGGSISGD